MSLDERIKSLARQVVAETCTAPALSVDPGELAAALAQLGALHEELHAVATRVAALEKQAESKTGGGDQSQPGAVSRASRPRRATSE